MENRSDDAEFTRPPVAADLVEICRMLKWKTKQTYREKDEIDRIFLRKLLIDRGEWPVV